jgi:hypothetical protein
MCLSKSAIFLVATLLAFSAPCFADVFDDAERLHDQFVDHQSELGRLTKTETEAIVKAICEAEEDDRKSASRDISERVHDHVNNEYDKLLRLRDDAYAAIDKVTGDDNFKDKWDKAQDYRRQIGDLWSSIERMTQAVRGANHPVVAYMLEGGQEAHHAYENNSGNCTVSEWELGSGRADCIKADSCEVIEVKPNNSRSVYKGRDQARGYADRLNSDDSEMAKLIDKDKSFEKCKEQKFKPKLVLYHFCPEIDDKGEFRSLSVGWDQD